MSLFVKNCQFKQTSLTQVVVLVTISWCGHMNKIKLLQSWQMFSHILTCLKSDFNFSIWYKKPLKIFKYIIELSSILPSKNWRSNISCKLLELAHMQIKTFGHALMMYKEGYFSQHHLMKFGSYLTRT